MNFSFICYFCVLFLQIVRDLRVIFLLLIIIKLNTISKIMKRFFFPLLVMSLFFVGCKEEIDEEAQMNTYVNEWLHQNMSAYYYWNTMLPVFKTNSGNPETYFKSLIYKDDRFSAIFDSYQEILNELNGVRAAEIGFEFELRLESYTNNNVVGIVLYTKPGTYAASLGIKRGDVFRRINGQQITKDNYSGLINALYDSNPGVALTFSTYKDGVFTDKTPVTVNKVTGYMENPVYLDTVYTIQNKKIGYLVYNFFTNDAGDNTLKYDLDLNNSIGMFKQENITELIIDLRYNHGGMMTSAVNLASMLVPNLTSNMVFSYTNYNNNLTNYFNSSEFKSKNPGDPFKNNFTQTIDVTVPTKRSIAIQNIGSSLQRIYFLTGQGTASASEMVINGLKPFLPCVLIGDTTVGKNVGSILINDEDNAKNQWAFMPIVLRYFNKDHQSDFTKGFAPDFVIEDDYKNALGNINEALLAKAISQITGVPVGVPQKVSMPKISFGSALKTNRKKDLLVVKSDFVRRANSLK